MASLCCEGGQLAVDATLFGVLHIDGVPEGGKRTKMVWCLLHFVVGRNKSTLVAAGQRHVVLERVVGGSVGRTETWPFLSHIAKVRSRDEISLMQKRVEQAWHFRLGSMVARTVAPSLLDFQRPQEADSAVFLSQEMDVGGTDVQSDEC